MDKVQLLTLLQNSEQQLSRLKSIDYDGLKGKIIELESTFNEFKEGGESLLSDNEVLQIGIVGQVKAGKSSFLNSLFFNGENILPKASTPMTAGLTVLEFAEKNTFEVEYFNEKDWDIFVEQDQEYQRIAQEVREQQPDAPTIVLQKEIESRTSEKQRSAHEMVSLCSSAARQKVGARNDVKEFFDLKDLQNVLEQYVGAKGEYTSVVKSLYIKMNDERLRGVRVVDTPGVNDPVVSRENRTRTFLHACHGVFLLSASTDFLSAGDVSFLNSRIGGSGIGTVVLLASKFDSVLQDLGADLEMKNQGGGDLVELADTQKKKFKKRLRELSDTIDEKLRGRIKLDTTAGIGFSIAQKSEAQWDNVEQQVVKRMRHYFPEYFENDAELRQTFDALANIGDIRSSYLEGLFLQNKESIISEKVQAFFLQHKADIAETIGQMQQSFQLRREELQASSLEEIEKQKQQQAQLFEALQGEFSNIFSDFERGLQAEVRSIGNNVRFNVPYSLPKEQVEMEFTCKGRWWGHNQEVANVTQVNGYALGQQLCQAIQDYAQGWNQAWKHHFETARREMADKLSQKIGDFEAQVMSRTFNDRYYRQLIDSVLNDLRTNKELSIGSTIERYQAQARSISDKTYLDISDTRERKESEARSYIESKAREQESDMRGRCEVLASSIRSDVSTEVNKNLSEVSKVIASMKSNFADKLKAEGKVYLEELEKDLLEQTKTLQKIDSILEGINALAQLYR